MASTVLHCGQVQNRPADSEVDLALEDVVLVLLALVCAVKLCDVTGLRCGLVGFGLDLRHAF